MAYDVLCMVYVNDDDHDDAITSYDVESDGDDDDVPDDDEDADACG